MNSKLKYTDEVILSIKVKPAKGNGWVNIPINMTFNEWLDSTNLSFNIPKIKSIQKGFVVFENMDAWKYQKQTSDRSKAGNMAGLFIAVTQTSEIKDEEAFDLYTKRF